MNLETKKIGTIIEIFLSGRLDVHLSASIEKSIDKLIEEEPGTDLLINLKDVEYMSSSGLRIFVSTMRVLKESKRKLVLCHMNDSVKKIFEVVELMDMFDIYDTEEAALEALKKE